MLTFKKLREACWAGYKAVGLKKKGNKMVPNCVPEEAPANSAGGGGVAGIGVGPDGEPGINVKKKKKDLTKLLTRFTTVKEHNKVELENIINKIDIDKDVKENQIEPIIKNLKRKKQQGTFNEEVAIKTFRYVVDNQLPTNVSEKLRNQVANYLLEKYSKEI
tara:strand:+ start:751 stop:1236 length:486 start_codon:yes stop_codon:yes gene_type:complete